MKDKSIKNYLDTQKTFFEDTHHLMVPNNHYAHNPDPEYWDILLKDIKSEPKKWENKRSLDFGSDYFLKVKSYYIKGTK